MYAKIKFVEKVELKTNEKAYVEVSLLIVLTFFSQKYQNMGGPTKAISNLKIYKDLLSEEIMLSVRGIEGNLFMKMGFLKVKDMIP